MKIISKSLTLIELVVSITILTTILTLGAFLYQKIRQEKFPLEKNAQLVKRILESAKEFAILGKNHSNWSVYIENNTSTNDVLYIFQGNNFTTSSIWRAFPLTGEIDFVIPQTATTVTFQLWTGETSSTTLKMKSHQSSKTAEILIYPSGVIEIIMK